jgi:3-oxoacyl-[acyl-carrier-protein] synthase-3
VQQTADYGITGFGYAFGEDQDVATTAVDYVTDPERVQQWGYRTFHRAPPGVTSVALAAEAARDALKQLDLTVDDLDLVALATSEMPDYHYWDSSAGLARELGIAKTQTLLLTEGCASGVTGLGIIAGLFALQPELETAIFVAVNRVSEAHRNRMNVNNSVHSDGAVAVVLSRGHDRLTWLSTDQFTDPDLCDFFRNDYGAGAEPAVPSDWTSATAPSGSERVQAHFDRDARRLGAFVDTLNQRVVDVVDGACRRAGVDRRELSRVIYINDSPDAVDDIAKGLGLPLERSNAQLSVEHGHMGAADQLVSLGQHLERGDIADGDLVALCGISIGMRWYCTLVRV